MRNCEFLWRTSLIYTHCPKTSFNAIQEANPKHLLVWDALLGLQLNFAVQLVSWRDQLKSQLYTQQIHMKYLLPELSDRRGEVSGICSCPECLVLAEGVLHAVVRVPFVVAACPGEFWLKALEQVVQAPGQDHNVVDVQERNNHNGCVADTWTQRSAKIENQRPHNTILSQYLNHDMVTHAKYCNNYYLRSMNFSGLQWTMRAAKLLRDTS